MSQVINYKEINVCFIFLFLDLILEDSQDTIILIFNSDKETNQFIEGAKILIDVMLGYKSEVDSDIIKCFIKSDINKNYVI